MIYRRMKRHNKEENNVFKWEQTNIKITTILTGITVKLWNRKTYNCKTHVMTFNRPMNINISRVNIPN